jgi:hypothetical protein
MRTGIVLVSMMAESRSKAELASIHQVVTILDLGEKEPVLTAATFAFTFFEEGSQAG